MAMSLVRHGDHICCLFDTDQEHLDIAARYIADGLRQREHCLYCGWSMSVLRGFRDRLAKHGVDVDAMVKTGALTLATSTDLHLAGGRFDAEWMLRLLSEKLETVMNAGFTGLRTCGDMSWLLDEPRGMENVVIYEALCTQFFESSRAVGMCMYNRARLPPGLIADALSTHPTTFVHGRCEVNLLDRSHEIAAARRGAADYGV
jgi:hypothetical protein